MNDKKYYNAADAESFVFFRIPKALITNPKYKSLSFGAKFLYGLMFDRMSLSVKNGWLDENGNVFIYYTVKSVIENMCCCREKAIAFIKELENIGLLDKVRQGLGKPNKIYVKRFEIASISSQNDEYSCECDFDTSVDVKNEVKKSEIPNCRSRKYRLQEVDNTDSNNTEYNNTEMNKTILPSVPVVEEELKYALEYDLIKHDKYFNREQFSALVTIMAETICSTKDTFRFNGEDVPKEAVVERLKSLNHMHLEYVIEVLNESTDIKNIRAYSLALLYNAPNTIDAYYRQMVRRDLGY